MSEAGTLECLLLTAGEALESLSEKLQPDIFEDYLAEFGIRLPDGIAAGPLAGPLAAAETASKTIAPVLGPLRDAIEAAGGSNAATVIAAGTAVAAQITATAAALNALATAFEQAASGVADADIRARLEAFAAELPRRILGRLTLEALDRFSVEAVPLLAIAGLADDRMEAGVHGDPNQQSYYLRRVYFDRIGKLASDPAAHLRDSFGWGTPDFDPIALFERIKWWFWSRGERIYWLGEQDLDPPDTNGLGLPWVRLLKDTSQSPPGLAVEASGALDADVEREVPLGSSGWVAYAMSNSRFEAGLRAVLWPDGRLQVSAIGGPTISARMGLRLERPDGEPAVLLGLSGGTRLEARKIDVSFSVEGLDVEPSLQIEFEQLSCVLDLGGGDSFLKSLSGGERGRSDVSVGATWSPTMGLRFTGSTAFETAFPVHARLGPAAIETIYVISDFKGSAIVLDLSAAVCSELGPFKASVDRVGVEFTASFPENGGNLGPVQLDTRFKPPSGVGLAIDAPAVLGGGFLRFEPRKEEYSGILQLKLAEKIAVTATGLLITRMPDGAKGYALLIVITAGDFEPIPLPLGFRLTEIGGLLAVNRTFAEDVLRAGLKNHALDSVMFPQDPVRNAPQILSNLSKVFPPADGRYLIGPMAQLEWGTPTLITAKIAVVLEFGARLRLLVLAQIAAILPEPKNDLIRLQLDAVGVVDFDQGTAAVDASLYDSRLLRKFVLTGDMALRLKWVAPPDFAMAVGGLHPAFNPPPNFPKLERIAINLAAGDNPRIRCEAYFALTGSSIQFGARAELYASAAGFSVQGEIGFDVLIQRDPFAFVASFSAQVQLKRGMTNLFKVRVEGALAGPRPLHVKAKATFEILWWDASIRVDRTLVSGEPPPLPAPVDVLPLLLAALGLADSWSARLPTGQQQGVTLRARPELAGEILLHPLGRLTVRQTVVPLEMDISRFGDVAPTGARRFTIGRVTPAGQTESPEVVRDFFAPAQFFEMSDDEKLSRPSFESLPAGVSLGAEGFAFSADPAEWLEVPAIQFETIIVGQPEPPDGPPPPLYDLPAVLLARQARFGAAANSDLRRTGTAKYRTVTEGKHRVAKEGWSIVAEEDLAVQAAPGVAGRPASYSQAEQALAALKQADPARARDLKLLRLSDVRG